MRKIWLIQLLLWSLVPGSTFSEDLDNDISQGISDQDIDNVIYRAVSELTKEERAKDKPIVIGEITHFGTQLKTKLPEYLKELLRISSAWEQSGCWIVGTDALGYHPIGGGVTLKVGGTIIFQPLDGARVNLLLTEIETDSRYGSATLSISKKEFERIESLIKIIPKTYKINIDHFDKEGIERLRDKVTQLMTEMGFEETTVNPGYIVTLNVTAKNVSRNNFNIILQPSGDVSIELASGGKRILCSVSSLGEVSKRNNPIGLVYDSILEYLGENLINRFRPILEK
jgi:hypothetical protein